MSDWCYRLFRGLARPVSAPFVALHIWRAPGAVETPAPAVIVSNHISHFDPIFLSFAFQRPIDWMTTAEFYENWALAAWLRSVNTFPVDRSRPDRRVLRLGAERLRAGRLVGVFPEGGIRAGSTSILGGAAPKSGATALARLAAVSLVPCLVLGTDRLYATRSWWPVPPRTPVWVAIGAAIFLKGEDESHANARMAGALRELGAAASAHFAFGPDDLPATPQSRKGREASA